MLPGAFSAYRWDAISRATRTANGHVSRPSPLFKYFEGEEGEWVELHEVRKEIGGGLCLPACCLRTLFAHVVFAIPVVVRLWSLG